MTRLALALLALAGVAAAGRTRICGNEPTPEKVAGIEAKFKSLMAEDDGRAAFAAQAKGSTIPTYFHVIRSGTVLTKGNVPASQINAQMDVLNKDYAATGYDFKLQNISYVDNPEWWTGVGPQNDLQTKMKQSLRVGDASALNVYLVSFDNTASKGLLGYATFPSDYEGAPKDDGVVVLYTSLPGGTSVPFNEGRTLTHEVGHWVGLFHTFQGGCADGDQVKDTPAQGSPTSGCPSRADTCPDSPGDDAIHSYMDYSDDSCMTEFTPGQITRMQQQVQLYRGLSARKGRKTAQPSTGATSRTA